MPAPMLQASSRLAESEPNLGSPINSKAVFQGQATNQDNLLKNINLFTTTSSIGPLGSSFILNQRQNFMRLRQKIQWAANRAIGVTGFKGGNISNPQNDCPLDSKNDILDHASNSSLSKQLESCAIDESYGLTTNLESTEDQSGLNSELRGTLKPLKRREKERLKSKFIACPPIADESDATVPTEANDLSQNEDAAASNPIVFPFTFNNEKPILVLDLDETLIHSSLIPRRTSDFWIEVVQNNDIRTREVFWVYKRPGVDKFLQEISEHYNVYIFTAGIREYASQILHRLDPTGSIFKGRLFRDECTEIKGQGSYAKDLSKITDDLNRVILVDNTPACFTLQPANGLPIKSWYSDTFDQQLYRLQDFLVEIVNAPDFRLSLTEWDM